MKGGAVCLGPYLGMVYATEAYNNKTNSFSHLQACVHIKQSANTRVDRDVIVFESAPASGPVVAFNTTGVKEEVFSSTDPSNQYKVSVSADHS